jgi:hypothetical protein
MLSFFGLALDRDPVSVRELPDFRERAQVWLGSHNLLRITRMLLSLRLLGLEPYARAFFDYLEQLYRREPAGIGASFAFWSRAIR